MPIYAFKCKKCENVFEELVDSVDSIEPCPECGSKKVEKVLSVPAAPVVKDSSSCCEAAPSCPMAGGMCPGGSCGLK